MRSIQKRESEVSRLAAVVAHTPGREHDPMMPENIVQEIGGVRNPDNLTIIILCAEGRHRREDRE